MIYTVFDYIIIIGITIASLSASRFPELFIMAAGFLMLLITYESFQEEKGRALFVLEFLLVNCFAVLSGGFLGFIIFFLLESVRAYIRAILGVSLLVITTLLFDKNMPFAMYIVETLLFITAFLFLQLVHELLVRIEKRKEQEAERLMLSNISEMHEKSLKEQLIMQNFLAEKNARLVERENISRNIHNTVGHSITAAIMTLDAADVLYDVRPEEARKRMKDANDRIRGSLESIRRAVRVLDEEHTEILSGDLKCEMEEISKKFVMDTNIRVDQDFSRLLDDIKIPRDHGAFLTGALQEMLTNSVKHGNASECIVILFGDTAHIRLEVSDNGYSDFNLLNSKSRIENGFGIRKLISYAERCGGKTLFVNENGFKGMIELPIGFTGV